MRFQSLPFYSIIYGHSNVGRVSVLKLMMSDGMRLAILKLAGLLVSLLIEEVQQCQ